MAKQAKKIVKTTTCQYDKVFKENAEEIYTSLIKAVFHIDLNKAHDLKETDLQRTISANPIF